MKFIIFLFFISIFLGCVEPYSPTGESTPVAPQIVSISPENGAENVGLDSTITISFSEEINSLTITENSIILNDNSGNSVPYSALLSEDLKSLTLTPNALKENNVYTISIFRVIQDLDGVPLDIDGKDSSFRNSFSTLKTVPFVLEHSFENSNVVSSTISSAEIRFSEKMDPSTINNGSIFISDIEASVYYNYETDVATLNFISSLTPNQSYNLIITSKITDQYGVPLDKNYNIKFTTNND